MQKAKRGVVLEKQINYLKTWESPFFYIGYRPFVENFPFDDILTLALERMSKKLDMLFPCYFFKYSYKHILLEVYFSYRVARKIRLSDPQRKSRIVSFKDFWGLYRIFMLTGLLTVANEGLRKRFFYKNQELFLKEFDRKNIYNSNVVRVPGKVDIRSIVLKNKIEKYIIFFLRKLNRKKMPVITECRLVNVNIILDNFGGVFHDELWAAYRKLLHKIKKNKYFYDGFFLMFVSPILGCFRYAINHFLRNMVTQKAPQQFFIHFFEILDRVLYSHTVFSGAMICISGKIAIGARTKISVFTVGNDVTRQTVFFNTEYFFFDFSSRYGASGILLWFQYKKSKYTNFLHM